MKDNQICLWDKYRRQPLQITGPITTCQIGEDEFQVLDGTDTVRITVQGRELARQISGLIGWHIKLGALY